MGAKDYWDAFIPLVGFGAGPLVYFIARFLGLLFPIILILIWWIPKRKEKKFPVKFTIGTVVLCLIMVFVYGWSVFGGLNLLAVIGWVWRTGAGFSNEVLRGTKIATSTELQRNLFKKETELLKRQGKQAVTPKIEIGSVILPNYLETLSFGFFGSPGSGKSQSILQILNTLRQRNDWRVFILDRNGELMEKLWIEGDIIFNPKDARSVAWSHRGEGADFSTIAAGLIPDDPKEKFFSDAAKNLIADIYEITKTNSEVWEVLTRFSMQDLKDFLSGTVSGRYFEGQSGNTAGSIISTAVNQVRFYKHLIKVPGEAEFSFSNWGRNDDSSWVFLPLFEDDAETFKPLLTTAFELMLRGLLSNEKRRMKTALVIDELGALSQLKSLPRLLSESRKFGGTAFLGTQTTAQIEDIYGGKGSRIILQGLATKLILNVRDAETAEQMSKLIGVQERIDITFSESGQGFSSSEQIRETAAVLPSQLQNLPPLKGYLTIADGSPPALVKIQPKSYPSRAERLFVR